MNKDFKKNTFKEISIKDRKRITGNIMLFLRELYKYQQKDIAEMIGIHPQTYRTYEIGRNEAPQEIIVRLAMLYEVPTDFLLQNTYINLKGKTRYYAITIQYDMLKYLYDAELQLSFMGYDKSNETYKLICEQLEPYRQFLEELNKRNK